MWITKAMTAAALMLPGQVESAATLTLVAHSAGYNACIYNCTVACGEVYVESRACAEKRQLCNRDCLIKFPADYTGCNKGWMPTAKGCKCIKPLLSNGICPK
jgi:hypothetical protein